MLKDFLRQNHISTYKLAQMSGLPYSTVNDLVNCKVDVEKIRAGMLFKLADSMDISMDALYQMCRNEIRVYSEKFDMMGRITVKNKTYILGFSYKGKEFTEVLYPVKKEATLFIETIALWIMEEKISAIKMEETYAVCIKTKR